MSNSSIYDQFYSTENQNTHNLLSQQDYETCLKLAAGNKPWSQRSQALIELDNGVSETVASERSGLRISQIRYWLNKYNKMGRAIFPADVLQGIGEPTTMVADSAVDGPQKTVDKAGQKRKSKKKKKSEDKKKKDKKKKNKTKPGKVSKKEKKAKSGEKKK